MVTGTSRICGGAVLLLYFSSIPIISLRRRRRSSSLRRARKAEGLSQEALAHEADVDRTYFSALERSVYSATIDMIDKLAKALGVEADPVLQRPKRSRQGRPCALL